MLNRDIIVTLVAYLGSGKGVAGLAARICERHRESITGQRKSLVALVVQVGNVGVAFLIIPDQRGLEARGFPFLRQDKRNRLLAEQYSCVVKRAKGCTLRRNIVLICAIG